MDKHEFTSNQLAADRTAMAQERTLMAWIRTATSMISFGFTIFKFFEGRTPVPHAFLTSREFAIVMIGAGNIALLLATVQHISVTKELVRQTTRNRMPIAFLLAILVGVLGILALLAAIWPNG